MKACIRFFCLLLASVGIIALSGPNLHARHQYELWVIDQADGADGGGKLYIYKGEKLQSNRFRGVPEVIDLVAAGGGTRPHMVLFNRSHTHAIISHAASENLYIMRASDRTLVANLVAKAHAAMPSPDDTMIAAVDPADQSLTRIQADFVNETFTFDETNDVLDLSQFASQVGTPFVRPICPIFSTNSQKLYVTLAQGGLLVIDMRFDGRNFNDPTRLIKAFTPAEIEPNGCGGIIVGNKIYINSGRHVADGPQRSVLYVIHASTDELLKTLDLSAYGSDGHGMLLPKHGRYVWVVNRSNGDNAVVVDTATDEVVRTVEGIGEAPDLIDLSPDGNWAFVTLRGLKPRTGTAGSILPVGVAPRISVLQIKQRGRAAIPKYTIPVGDPLTGDPHGLRVRIRAGRRRG
jgi:DNA-binding beta-propeller fold protein YncE